MAEDKNNNFENVCRDFITQAVGKRLYGDALAVLKMMADDEDKTSALRCLADAAPDKVVLETVVASAALMPLAEKKKLCIPFISAMVRLGLGHDDSLGSNSIASVLGILDGDADADQSSARGVLLEAYAAQGNRDQFFIVARSVGRPITEEEIGKLIDGIQRKQAQEEAARAGEK